MNEQKALELYDDFLNEVYPDLIIAGYNYDTAIALKELDPIAYRCGFNDWCDSEGIEVDDNE